MAETLTTGRLNRALLARQLLLERHAVSIPDALERMAGIQNQYAPNAYLRLWSCLAEFHARDLTAALESSTVVQGTLMRGTIHLVSAADYHPMAAGLRTIRRTWARRVHGTDDAERDRIVKRVRVALGAGAVPRARLREILGDASAAAAATIDTDAELLRVPPSGTWARRRADRYALADSVMDHEEVSEAAGLELLVRRYLGGFGPAAVADIASFVGTPVTPLKPIVAAMDLRRFRDEPGGELLDLPGAPLPDEDAPAPVRFLPTWDAILLVHARRTGVLPEALRPVIFSTKMPPSYPTVLVDGRVAATWRFDADRVNVEPLRDLDRTERDAVDEEGERLAAFHRSASA
ncbi:MAG: winged helix DNA-binding domain-containing protein [Chloroflexi bacterium]|nr:winged helix DNA-binding domain-containing protein [Chloroflexota bacterium]